MRPILAWGIVLLPLGGGCGPAEETTGTPEPLGAAAQPLVGVPEHGYPNYQERLMLVAINRARANPNVVGQTASSCYNSRTIRPPLMLNTAGSRAARFHSANSAINDGGLSHDSYCTLLANIGTTFESTCDGSESCSCQAGTEHFSCTTGGGSGTDFGTRCSRFGFSASAEVGAVNQATGWEAVWAWMSECPPNTGHRDILTSTYNEIGLGYYTRTANPCWDRFYFGDLGNNGPAVYTLPAGVHRPETGTNFTFYVNYYDAGGAPQSMNVVVDGVCQAMTVEIGSGGNATYSTSRTVTSACHQYWFLARDSSGARKTYPEVGAWGVGNCTGYVASATAADCEICSNGQTQPCGTGQCAGTQTCTGGTWSACDGDPPSAEICDGVDNACDGSLPANEADADSDGYMICEGDCNDASGSVHPGATETCNGVDDDCANGVPANEADADNDGYMLCEGDCNDASGSVHPGATETCNGVDDDCANGVPANEADADNDGYRPCEGDCDDGSAAVHPGATETCNGVDDNCTGGTDEGCPCTQGQTQPCGTDAGECVSGTQTCTAGSWGPCVGSIDPVPEECNGLDDDCVSGVPASEADSDNDGYRGCEGDCNDASGSVHPGAAEACNGVDDDCANGVPANEADADDDGYRICEGDCNDASGSVHPGAAESCNGVDDNCVDGTDEGCPCTAGESRPCGSDEGQCVSGTQSCTAGTWGTCEGATWPTPEECNGLDDDCVDGLPADEADADTDGVMPCEGDCDDADDAVFPDAVELCNGADDDCDGDTDEECGCAEGDSRTCGTDVGECRAGTQLCEAGTWGSCEGAIEPVTEACSDGLDNDCDGESDEGCGEGGAGGGGGAGDGGGAGGTNDAGNGPAAQEVLTGSCGCVLVGAEPRATERSRRGSPGGAFLMLGSLGLLLRRRRLGSR